MHIHAKGYWLQSTGLSYTLLYLKQFKNALYSFNKAHVYEYMQVLSLGEYEWMSLNPFLLILILTSEKSKLLAFTLRFYF